MKMKTKYFNDNYEYFKFIDKYRDREIEKFYVCTLKSGRIKVIYKFK